MEVCEALTWVGGEVSVEEGGPGEGHLLHRARPVAVGQAGRSRAGVAW